MSDTLTEIIESYAYEKLSPYFAFEERIQITDRELYFLAEVWVLQEGLQKTWNYLRTHPDERDASLVGDIYRIKANNALLWDQCLALAINRMDIDLNAPESNNIRDIERHMSGFYLPDGKELTRIQLYLIVGDIHRTLLGQPFFFEAQKYVDDFPAFKRTVSHFATLLIHSGYLYTTSEEFDKNVQFLDVVPK